MPKQYIIQPGDTWFRIARRYETNIYALYAANPRLSAGGPLVPGAALELPEAARMVDDRTVPKLSAAQQGVPYGYRELEGDIARLSRLHPFLPMSSIGKSVEGRDLHLLRLGSGRKNIFVNGAFHANEWITSAVLMRYIERTAMASFAPETEEKMRTWSAVSVWFVPMVNPDGVELVHAGAYPGHPLRKRLLEWNGGFENFEQWKANVRGVDLNDQFPAYWEEERRRRSPQGPSPRDYAGEAPLSEPEAAAVAAFIESMDVSMILAFHTQGQEIYWNYRNFEPPESERIAEALALASGCKAVRLTGSDAGLKDWFIHRFRRPGFTIELGSGTNPLPISQLPLLYSQASAVVDQAIAACIRES